MGKAIVTKQTITAKVSKAAIDPDGRAVIEVVFKNAKSTWSKSYDYFTTQVIKEADLKARIQADIKRDLLTKDQLKEIEPLIGKDFTFEV